MPASLRAVLFYVGVSSRPSRDAGRRPKKFSQAYAEGASVRVLPLGVELEPEGTLTPFHRSCHVPWKGARF